MLLLLLLLVLCLGAACVGGACVRRGERQREGETGHTSCWRNRRRQDANALHACLFPHMHLCHKEQINSMIYIYLHT